MQTFHKIGLVDFLHNLTRLHLGARGDGGGDPSLSGFDRRVARAAVNAGLGPDARAARGR